MSGVLNTITVTFSAAGIVSAGNDIVQHPTPASVFNNGLQLASSLASLAAPLNPAAAIAAMQLVATAAGSAIATLEADLSSSNPNYYDVAVDVLTVTGDLVAMLGDAISIVPNPLGTDLAVSGVVITAATLIADKYTAICA